MLQAKSEEQLASEKAFLEAERVWLIHRDGFAPAGLLKSQNNNAISSGGNDSDLDNLEVKKVKVQLDLNGEVIEVDEDSHSKYIPPGASGIGAEEEMRGGSGRKRGGGGDDDDMG